MVRKPRYFSFPSLVQDHSVGFFDGVALEGVCGDGFVILFEKDRYIKGWLKAGVGTNSIAELIGIWSPLLCQRTGFKTIVGHG